MCEVHGGQLEMVDKGFYVVSKQVVSKQEMRTIITAPGSTCFWHIEHSSTVFHKWLVHRSTHKMS